MKICEFGEYSSTQSRCRKHAAYYVAYRVLFGHQITGTGEVPVYKVDATWRCSLHETAGLADVVGRLTLKEYATKLAYGGQA